MSKGKRHPTGEELQLWQKVTETVAPLPKRQKPRADKKGTAATKGSEKEKPKAKPAPPPSPQPRRANVAPPLRKPPALNPFDRRTLGRIGRGTVAIDRRIDLHGLTQEAARRRLLRFLGDAQADGAKLVLVITGKGRSGAGEERGVLRRAVPMWLASPELRPIVVGYDEAGPTHGGGGALYVRLRRAGKGSARA